MYYSKCLALATLTYTFIMVIGTSLFINNSYCGGQLSIRPGDWIEYELNWEDPPPWPYPVWVRREILSVQGTNITVTITQQLSNGTILYNTMEGEVLGGTGSAAMIFVPPNLNVGDVVYIEGFGNVTISNETTRTYLGFNRVVVGAELDKFDMHIVIYWDKEKGVALEIHNSNNFISTTKVIKTNLFTPSSAILTYYFIIFLLVGFILWVSIFTYMRNKRLSLKKKSSRKT